MPAGKNTGPLGPTVFVNTRTPLSQRRVALITTAGLHYRDDTTFDLMDASYRVNSGDCAGDDLMMSHSSVNFDRSGFQKDLKSYYQEALTAQPGPADPQAIAHLLWQETELGRAMRSLADRCLHHENSRLQAFARGIAPRSQMGG